MAGSRPVSDMIGSSNRLGSGPRNTNYAGANTSVVGVGTAALVHSSDVQDQPGSAHVDETASGVRHGI
jgi:rhamnose utilization protein RhaD (predicted bifunctional aldolase and dehydrogenase)